VTVPSRFAITDSLSGERADKILASVAGISRSAARALCDLGSVTVDGRVVAASDRVTGTVMGAAIPERGGLLVPDPSVPFTVLHADPDLLVVDKPAGVVVHPGAGTITGTLAAGLVARYPDLAALPADARWGIVHRLDKDTSGLLLVARSPLAFEELQHQLRQRRIGRVYLALVEGMFDNATGTIEAPIGRHPTHPTRRAVVQGGKPARTHYRRLAAWKTAGVSLLEVRLETGRTHQIRVHLSAIGHPIVGDATYGRSSQPGDPGRTWLHAIELSFAHPMSGEEVVVHSPLPSDLAATLGTLGPPASGAVPVD
jgi:23S rRNA pseudouridine1911/1915/1917 synthase